MSLFDYFAYHSNRDMYGGAQEARNFPVLHDLSNWVADAGIHYLLNCLVSSRIL